MRRSRSCSSPIAARSRSASSARPTSSASAPSPSTPTKTASPCIASRPTRPIWSASRASRSAPTSTSTAIVALAKEHGVDAIHPGYGFLSENPEFAAACAKAGITFVGPRVELLETLGDKTAARELAKRAGVPILAGSPKPVAEPGRRARDRQGARLAGDPQGGPRRRRPRHAGGPRRGRARRGARERPAREQDGLRQRERVRREVHPAGPAHRGAAARRPPRQPGAPLRARLLGAAAAPEGGRDRPRAEPRREDPRRRSARRRSRSAARSAYENAGTVEFLVDADTGKFYFIEVNPRIQVEHTVTEEITGIDIVAAAAPAWPRATSSPTRRSACGDQAAIQLDGHRHPVPRHDRGPREPVSPRLRPDHGLPLGQRHGHPARRRHRPSRAPSSRPTSTRCW